VETTRRHYIATPRHTLEIEYRPFYRALERAIPADAPGWGERERNPVAIEQETR
jgi:hypothetical protein